MLQDVRPARGWSGVQIGHQHPCPRKGVSNTAVFSAAHLGAEGGSCLARGWLVPRPELVRGTTHIHTQEHCLRIEEVITYNRALGTSPKEKCVVTCYVDRINITVYIKFYLGGAAAPCIAECHWLASRAAQQH